MSASKGNTTYSNIDPVATDYIKLYKKIINNKKNISISGDILFAKNISLFTTTTCNIKLTTIKCIIIRITNHIFSSMGTFKSLYTKGIF